MVPLDSSTTSSGTSYAYGGSSSATTSTSTSTSVPNSAPASALTSNRSPTMSSDSFETFVSGTCALERMRERQ